MPQCNLKQRFCLSPDFCTVFRRPTWLVSACVLGYVALLRDGIPFRLRKLCTFSSCSLDWVSLILFFIGFFIHVGSLQNRVSWPYRDHVNNIDHNNRWWYKMVARNKKSLNKLVRLPILVTIFVLTPILWLTRSRDPVVQAAAFVWHFWINHVFRQKFIN